MQITRIALICFGLDTHQSRKQPWHTVLGIATGLHSQGAIVSVFTDSPRPPAGMPFDIAVVGRLYDNTTPSTELLSALDSFSPDRIIVTAGTHELLRPLRFKLQSPVSLLLANQLFGVRIFTRISILEWLQEGRMLRLPLIQSCIPAVLLRKGLMTAGISHIIYLSEAAQKCHMNAGLPPGSIVTPRVMSSFASDARTGDSESAETVFCYYGPPLSLRGARSVVDAFNMARKLGMRAKLRLQVRVDDPVSHSSSEKLKRYISTVAGVARDDINYDDRNLPSDLLAKALQETTVFVLPFKITVSDVPLVVIEAALSGKQVITLDTPGVGEWRKTFPNIITTDPAGLWGKMHECARNAREPMAVDAAPWSDWTVATSKLMQAITEPIDCSPLRQYRMICLIGVDGCGKTSLLSALSEQLGMNCSNHTYVWSRFRNYLSKPLLGLLRITGHNRKIVRNGIRMGVHDFSGSPMVSRLFLLLQQVDLLIDLQLRYRPRLKQGILLSDRCLLDTLVDLAIDTGMEDHILGDYGKNLFRKLPTPSLIVMVTRHPDVSAKDRPDILADPNYEMRLALYNRMAQAFGIHILRNDGTIDDGIRQLCRIAGERKHA